MPHSESGLFEKDLMKGILHKAGGEALREEGTELLRASSRKGRAGQQTRERVGSTVGETGFQLRDTPQNFL